jgi:two-component system response regulator YesN
MREPRTQHDLPAHVMQLIEQRYADQLTTAKIARMMGRSPLVLRHEFSRAMGMSLRDYLTIVRLERAQELLQAREKVEAVALQVGYRSKRQFIRQFKSHVGMIPSDFRRLDGES